MVPECENWRNRQAGFIRFFEETGYFKRSRMKWAESSERYSPVVWIRGYPLYAHTFLILLHVIAMLGLVLTSAFRIYLPQLAFSSGDFSQGRLWTWITYAFVHSPNDLLAFAIEMYVLYWAGREVERFLGTRTFFLVYFVLMLVPPLGLTLLNRWYDSILVGSSTLHFAVFTCFATIYPNVELMFRILAKWVFWIFFGISFLAFLAARAWSELLPLTLSCGSAYLFMKYLGVGSTWAWWEKWQESRRLRQHKKKAALKVVKGSRTTDSIDAILDKISKHGIGSLTASERAELEKARTELLKRDKK